MTSKSYLYIRAERSNTFTISDYILGELKFTNIDNDSLTDNATFIIAEWRRSIRYVVDRVTKILYSTLYETKEEDIFILQLILFVGEDNMGNKDTICIKFKYQDLLLTPTLKMILEVKTGSKIFFDPVCLKRFVIFGGENDFVLNIYFKYVCSMIQKYKMLVNKSKFPLVQKLNRYLPEDLSQIIQYYLLADDFVLKDADNIGQIMDFSILTSETICEKIQK